MSANYRGIPRRLNGLRDLILEVLGGHMIPPAPRNILLLLLTMKPLIACRECERKTLQMLLDWERAFRQPSCVRSFAPSAASSGSPSSSWLWPGQRQRGTGMRSPICRHRLRSMRIIITTTTARSSPPMMGLPAHIIRPMGMMMTAGMIICRACLPQ